MEIQNIPVANRNAIEATQRLHAASNGGGVSDEPLCWFLVYEGLGDDGKVITSSVPLYRDHRDSDPVEFWLLVAALEDGFNADDEISMVCMQKLGSVVSALAWVEFRPDFDVDDPSSYRSYKQLRDAARAFDRGDSFRLSLGWVEHIPPASTWHMKVLPLIAETVGLLSHD